MTKKVKNILFKLDIQGNGVVNYDSNDQKYLWNKNAEKAGVEFVKYDNVSFAKKRWYKNGDAIEKKIIISKMQTRAADEGHTVVYTCGMCGWRRQEN